MNSELLSWHAYEPRGRTRRADWYWILGIIATTLALASLFLGNILFAVVIVVGAFALGAVHFKRDEAHVFSLGPHGLHIGNTLYPYRSLISFSILEYIDPETPPLLSIHTKNILAPHLHIPLTNVSVDDVYDILSQYVPMEEHEMGLIDTVVDFLGF